MNKNSLIQKRFATFYKNNLLVRCLVGISPKGTARSITHHLFLMEGSLKNYSKKNWKNLHKILIIFGQLVWLHTSFLRNIWSSPERWFGYRKTYKIKNSRFSVSGRSWMREPIFKKYDFKTFLQDRHLLHNRTFFSLFLTKI